MFLDDRAVSVMAFNAREAVSHSELCIPVFISAYTVPGNGEFNSPFELCLGGSQLRAATTLCVT